MKPAKRDTLRVCIVDDERRLRTLLEREIAAMGYIAEGFRTAEAAWERIAAGEFDFVLLDLNLPGQGGMELFRRIREEKKLAVAVVVLTGFGEFDSAVEALRLHADEYLTKPCGLAEIERVLSVADQRRREAARRARMEPNAASDAAQSEQATESAGPASCNDLRPLEDVEREHIIAVLRAHDGNKPAAAKELSISLRTLYNKINAYRQQGFLE